MVEKENWCIQWSSEVLPEAAMVPDSGVFLWSEPANCRPRWQPEQIPARLRLPFRLSRSGVQRSMLASQRSGAPPGADLEAR
jgi:hypothetical protein